MSKWRSLLPLAWIVVVLLARPAGAEVRVQTSLEPDAVEAGEQSVLSVVVDGASSVDKGPTVPPVPGLTVQQAGQSTNISIVNGHMSRSVTFQFVLFAQNPGQYNVGPVEVREGRNVYRGPAVTLTVTSGGSSGGSAPPGGSPPAGGGAPGAGAGRNRGGAANNSAIEADEGNGDIFVRAEIDRDHVYVGEQITLRFQFYQKAGFPLLQAPQYNPPTTEGFWREDLPPQRTSQRMIRGEQYQVTELMYALFPTQAGRLDIGAGQLDCVVRGRARSRDPFDLFGGFFTERQVSLHSKPLSVRVDPLPEPRPLDFTGGVGGYRLSASLDRPEVAQNSPVSLNLVVEGKGNVSTVGDPKLPDLVGIRSYPSTSEVKSDKTGDVLGGKKSFQIVLIPESTGRKEIPPVRLSVFDPAQRKYVALQTAPISFNVVASAGGSAEGSGGEVTRIGRDLRTIRASTRLLPGDSFRIWQQTGFWAWQVLPLVLLGLAWGWRARRGRMEADWGLVLSRGAAGRLRKELATLGQQPGTDPAAAFATLDHALERYLTDRFHLPVRGQTREELLSHLTRQKISEAAMTETKAVLDRCDFARFAPASQSMEDFRRTLEQATKLPSLLEKKASSSAAAAAAAPLALCFVLVLGGVGHATPVSAATISGLPGEAIAQMVPAAQKLTRAQAAAAFADGNAAYQRGDFITAMRDYEHCLVSGLESPDLMLNLGNACYRAGRLGWAIYYFERGRRLASTDPDLKANLELALQETKDRVPEVDASRFLSGLVRLQEATSMSTALRWTALYWWLFLLWLAARLALTGVGAEIRSPGGIDLLAGHAGNVVGFGLGALLLLSVSWTGIKALQAGSAPNSVVVATELAVRSNPDPEATVEFSLHAGTRVRLGRESRGFREVLFSEKLRGWGVSEGLGDLAAPGEAAVDAREMEAMTPGGE